MVAILLNEARGELPTFNSIIKGAQLLNGARGETM